MLVTQWSVRHILGPGLLGDREWKGSGESEGRTRIGRKSLRKNVLCRGKASAYGPRPKVTGWSLL